MALEANKEEQFEMDEEIAVKQKLNPDSDAASPSKVKFTNDGKNGEAKVDVDKGYGGSVGMSKEELMKYANDPFWVRLRMFLFILFWVVWFAMLIGAIVIVAVAPKCPATSSLPWWQKTTIYQVYVRSFKDSNGDGEGDIKGLISKLDYFKDLGVETLILSPIYPTEMRDSGYDVTNFTDIDPRFGSLEDFDNLVEEIHSDGRKMKVIIDFIPNHTSNRHPWFNASLANDLKYKDFYVWHNGTTDSAGDHKPPNNWKSVFGGSAWSWSEERNQFYLHQFLPSQPDLNLRNPEVRQALKEVLQFWMRRKVDGIRIDAVSHLIEDENFEDEKVVGTTPRFGNDYNTTDHKKTTGQEENFDLLKEWRKTVHQFGQKKILLSESYEPTEQLLRYYGKPTERIIDLPFNFGLMDVGYNTNADKLRDIINSWLTAVEKLAWPSNLKPPAPWAAFATGNHDKSRLATRIGQRLSEAIQMLTFIIPRNTPVVYYGDELGMQDNQNIPTQALNEGDSSRMSYRSLMQWNRNTSSSGFSDEEGVKTWTNAALSANQSNVETEMSSEFSHLKQFKALVALRNSGAEAILLGKTYFPNVNNTDNVFIMIRVTDDRVEGQNSYLLAINLNSATTKTVRLNEEYLSERGTVILADSQSKDLVGQQIQFSEFTVEPQQSFLVEFLRPQDK